MRFIYDREKISRAEKHAVQAGMAKIMRNLCGKCGLHNTLGRSHVLPGYVDSLPGKSYFLHAFEPFNKHGAGADPQRIAGLG